jgi:predicted dienelactone hydrolase
MNLRTRHSFGQAATGSARTKRSKVLAPLRRMAALVGPGIPTFAVRDGTYGALRVSGLARLAARLMRAGVLAGLIAAWVLVAAAVQVPAAAADTAYSVGTFDVGHTVKRIVVPGSALCPPDSTPPCRTVDVHLWYPADGVGHAPKAVYRSRLWGDDRVLPLGWAPLSWQVESQIAREGADIYPDGGAFPVIMFSHGNLNDPIDYAYTLELIASAGFVVAAPQQVDNSQDDVRIDYVNAEASRLAGTPTTLIPCNDGGPSPCSTRTTVLQSMQDRVRDISYTLDNLPDWFGDRVDMARVGVMGHSRGTVTALTAAGGSTTWAIEPEPRVKKVMGLAIGALTITNKVNLTNVTVPTLLVAGEDDQTAPQSISEFALAQIASQAMPPETALVSIPDAVHRSFDSTYCDQTQAAGAIAQANADALLDRQTVTGIVAPGTTGQGTSGRATDFCNLKTFINPVDIRPLVESITNPPFDFGTQHVPITGLTTNDVKDQVAGLAATFFGEKLN